MATRIQLRNDLASAWSTANPILAQGEIGIESDTGRQKIGDGLTTWNSLVYSAQKPNDNALQTTNKTIVGAINEHEGDIIELNRKVKVYTFDTMQDAQNASWLVAGDIVEVLGYYTKGDGGGHKRIVASTDDGSGVARGSLWLNYVIENGIVNCTHFGALRTVLTGNSAIFEKIKTYLSNNGTIIIPKGNFRFDTDLIIPQNITLKFEQGGVIMPNLGKKVTINGSIESGLTKIFQVTYTGATPRDMILTTFIDGLQKFKLFPEHFGAICDYDYDTGLGEDDSFFIQMAILTLERNFLHVLYFSDQNYHVKNSVVIRKSGLRLEGTGGVVDVTWGKAKVKGYIVGSTTAPMIIDYGNNESANNAGHMEWVGLKFLSGKGANKSISAIEYRQNDDGPHRGANFQGCSFQNFLKAIHFNNSNPLLACANVNVEGCYFRGEYAVYAQRKILSLRFVNNQSEQGGRIGGDISSGITITDNMLEGQPDTIVISGGIGTVVIENNYYEANTGKIDIKFSNASLSSYKIGNQRKGGDVYRLGSGIVIVDSMTNLEIPNNAIWQPATKLNGVVPFFDTTTIGTDLACCMALDPQDYIGSGLPQDVTSVGRYKYPTPSLIKTPFGNRKANLQTGLTGGFLNMTMTYSVDDFLIINIPIKYTDLDQSQKNFYLILYNDANEQVGGCLAEMSRLNSKWYLLTFLVKSKIGGTILRAKINPYGSTGQTGTGCLIAEISAYKTTISSNQAKVQPYIPYDDDI